MIASRALKPKLSLSISTATTTATRPALTLKSPSVAAAVTTPRTPISPTPISPTAHNTRLNQRGFSTMQQPSFNYTNACAASTKSILKKHSRQTSGATSKRIQFLGEPTVYCVTPIENTEDVYGGYPHMSKDEKRWGRRAD